MVERHAGRRRTLALRPQKHKHETPRGSIVGYVPETALVDNTTSPAILTMRVVTQKPGGLYTTYTYIHIYIHTYIHTHSPPPATSSETLYKDPRSDVMDGDRFMCSQSGKGNLRFPPPSWGTNVASDHAGGGYATFRKRQASRVRMDDTGWMGRRTRWGEERISPLPPSSPLVFVVCPSSLKNQKIRSVPLCSCPIDTVPIHVYLPGCAQGARCPKERSSVYSLPGEVA